MSHLQTSKYLQDLYHYVLIKKLWQLLQRKMDATQFKLKKHNPKVTISTIVHIYMDS